MFPKPKYKTKNIKILDNLFLLNCLNSRLRWVGLESSMVDATAAWGEIVGGIGAKCAADDDASFVFVVDVGNTGTAAVVSVGAAVENGALTTRDVADVCDDGAVVFAVWDVTFGRSRSGNSCTTSLWCSTSSWWCS